MTCRICVDLESLGGIGIISRFQDSRAKRDGFLVSFLQFVHVNVDVELLLRRAIWPIGGNMVWRQLKGKSPHTIDNHAVPVLVSLDLVIQ